MKVKMCLPKIATSLLSILEIVLATVVLVCAVEPPAPELPPLIAFLLVLSWSFWLCCVSFLQLGLIISECTIFVYGYSVFCVSPSP